MTPNQNLFIKGLRTHDGEAPYRNFERFCEMAYCALAKPMAEPVRAEALEARYMRAVERIGKEQTRTFADLLGLVALGIQETGNDFLGSIMMSDEVRAANRDAGQFFTPPEVSRMMAAMVLHDLTAELEEKPYLTVAEPASGAGGMILAVAAIAREQGVDVTRRLWFDATDISELCFHMTFIQMSLALCSGIARQDDTLCSREQPESAITCPSWRFLGQHGEPQVYREMPIPPAPASQVGAELAGQISLF